MTLTDKLTVVANALITKFTTNSIQAITTSIDGTTPSVDPKLVFYGDQSKIPAVPAICVEPSNKNRNFEGASRPPTTRNTLMVFVLIYHAGPEDQIARRQADELGEATEALIHQDVQLDNGGSSPGADLVISGLVTSFESGYTYRGSTLYRSVRLAYTAETKTRLS